MTDAPSATGATRAHPTARQGALGHTLRLALAVLGLGAASALHPPAAAAQAAAAQAAAAPGAAVGARASRGMRQAAVRPTVPQRGIGRPSVPASDDDVPTGTAPDPRLAPEEVVTIVLDALAGAAAAGGDADEAADADGAQRAAGAAGPFALVFAFASPGNRAAAGSIERFEAMVRDSAYRPLLHHRRAARGAMRVDGDRATQRVVVTSATGERVAYTFVLARQHAGAQRGCWLTESVTREAPSRLAAPFSA